jgi:uncharacterized phage protein (TIGR01671 family)
MREIKFRAFYDGAIYDVTEIMWSEQTAYIVERGNPENGETVPLSDIELVQFTGLRDRNNVEIYEGDIVTIARWQETPDEPDKQNYIVKIPRVFQDFGETNPIGEVIGNIYESPELLTV